MIGKNTSFWITAASLLLLLCLTNAQTFNATITKGGLSAGTCRGHERFSLFCVKPSQAISFNFTVINSGNSSINAGDLFLNFTSGGNDAFNWQGSNVTLSSALAQGQSTVLTGSILAPNITGRWTLKYRLSRNGSFLGDTREIKVEVTCSDGVFCNGMEIYINGTCQPGVDPCDDGQACTVNSCDEKLQLCHYDVTDPASCLLCTPVGTDTCTANCTNKQCGSDGCGSRCGEGCPLGYGCVDFQCVQASQPGTCRTPFDIGFKIGTQLIEGDNSDGVYEVTPKCNTGTTATTSIYKFTVPSNAGSVAIDARMSGRDTVLELRTECLNIDTVVSCSDDGTPPGNLGSRVAVMLTAGQSYYLICSGYSEEQVGPFNLTVKFIQGYVPECDGKFCGSDGGGGDCGPCASGETCRSDNRCYPTNCVPNCARGDGTMRECGDDGCLGDCSGASGCTGGKLCVPKNGTCAYFPACDHLNPTCLLGCGSNQYCGADCACHDYKEALPDLVINMEKLINEVQFDVKNFTAANCALVEKCLATSTPGVRRLLRFSVDVVNQGMVALTLPPTDERPDLFEWSPCHGHYHYSGFAEYFLEQDGVVKVQGHKQAYCMSDSAQHLNGPAVPCSAGYDCENPGISPGWSDLYGYDLDCQWIDITGVAPGEYQLNVEVNLNKGMLESSYENNRASITITIPAENSTSTSPSPSPSSASSLGAGAVAVAALILAVACSMVAHLL